MKKYIVSDEESGNRLDKVISILDNEISRTAVKRLIDEKNILVNGQALKASYTVKVGDVIEVEEIEPKDATLKAENIPIDVIYEDNDILVINKPKGMVVHPGNGNLEGTLANAVMGFCGESLSGIGGQIRPRYNT